MWEDGENVLQARENEKSLSRGVISVNFQKNVPTIKTVLIKFSKTQLMRLKL